MADPRVAESDRENLGTALYVGAFRVGAVLAALESADPATLAHLAGSEPAALDAAYIAGERLMAALKALGMRLNRRALGDAQDILEGEG